MAAPRGPGLRNQEEARNGLRALGAVLLVGGVILSALGLIDFFGAFNSFGAPHHFWMLFIGLPMSGWGWRLLAAGYVGTGTRYLAGEVAPVARDTMTYLRGDTAGATVHCASCGTTNDADARFCDGCGKALQAACPSCGTANDTDARFCDGCGQPLAGASSA